MRRGRYARVPYQALPHQAGDPDRLATVAKLHGLDPPDPDRARVLELGCGDGGNLLGLAAARPGTESLGVDAEPAAIERGAALAAEARLGGVRLLTADLRELTPPELGEADYVVIHGLWSWVPDDVREAALSLAAAAVREAGVVSVSYNALPGWNLWRAPREIALRAAGDEDDAALAHGKTVKALEEAAELHGRGSTYGALLGAAIERARAKDPQLLFHDDLADPCEPFALGEVVRRAGSHGLRYLAEGDLAHWWSWRLPAPLAARIRATGQDAVARQEAADLASGVDFKVTLFVPGAAEPEPEPDPAHGHDLWLTPRPDAAPLSETAAPPVRELFDKLLEPRDLLARPLSEMAEEGGLAIDTAAGAALRLAVDGHVRLHLRPPPARGRPSERPRVPALARVQAAKGERVATLLHGAATLEDPVLRGLVTLLDGNRDLEALPVALAELGEERRFNLGDRRLAALPGALERLGSAGLLEA